MRQVEALLEKAERSFFAARLLLEADISDFAASRAYYGYFYVAEALLLSEGLRFSSHGQVIAQYGYHFAREDRMDRRYHQALIRTFSLRQVADYDAEPDLDAEETQELIEEGRNFLNAAKDYLDREDTENQETRPEGR